jgi:hypothetical protein
MALVRVNSSEIPKISDDRIKEILAFDQENEDISDCPELTPEQLTQLRPFREFLAEREKRSLEQSKAQRKIA